MCKIIALHNLLFLVTLSNISPFAKLPALCFTVHSHNFLSGWPIIKWPTSLSLLPSVCHVKVKFSKLSFLMIWPRNFSYMPVFHFFCVPCPFSVWAIIVLSNFLFMPLRNVVFFTISNSMYSTIHLHKLIRYTICCFLQHLLPSICCASYSSTFLS